MRFVGLGAAALSLLAAGCSFDRDGVAWEANADGAVTGDIDAPIVDDIDAAVIDASVDVAVLPGDPDAATIVPDAAPGAPDAAPLPDAGPVNCPVGYQQGTGQVTSCYRLVTTQRTWAQAESDCANDAVGAHLAVVDAQAEYNAIQSAIVGEFWVGASDLKTEGTFLNVTGTPFVSNQWAAMQPDNAGGAEDCVELRDNGFNDSPCGTQRGYLCEIDGVPPDPTAF